MAKKPNPKGKKPRAKAAPANIETATTTATTPKHYNEIDAEEKALFLRHRPKVEAAINRVDSAVSDLRKLYKTAKAEGGFTKADFDYARQLDTVEAEAKTRAKIARNLLIAKYMGSDLGAQLDMFLEPSRVDSSERAAEEGQRDSMEGKTAKPSYDPSTAQYRAYMDAYNNDQEKRIKGGIKKLEPADDPEHQAIEKEKAETRVITKAQKEADAKAFAEQEAKRNAPPIVPKSGVPMTRSEFRAQQESARDQAESLFKKKGEAVN